MPVWDSVIASVAYFLWFSSSLEWLWRMPLKNSSISSSVKSRICFYSLLLLLTISVLLIYYKSLLWVVEFCDKSTQLQQKTRSRNTYTRLQPRLCDCFYPFHPLRSNNPTARLQPWPLEYNDCKLYIGTHLENILEGSHNTRDFRRRNQSNQVCCHITWISQCTFHLRSK